MALKAGTMLRTSPLMHSEKKLGVRSSDAGGAENKKMGIKMSFAAETTLLIKQNDGASPKRIRGRKMAQRAIEKNRWGDVKPRSGHGNF
jgi:hypothetical protein